jgi:hypothetical protein
VISQLFSKSNVGARFRQNIAHKSIKKCFLARASGTNKQQNKIVAHPAGNGNTQFGPTQQPTNNPMAPGL